jgi:hypothetical protein
MLTLYINGEGGLILLFNYTDYLDSIQLKYLTSRRGSLVGERRFAEHKLWRSADHLIQDCFIFEISALHCDETRTMTVNA